MIGLQKDSNFNRLLPLKNIPMQMFRLMLSITDYKKP